jgi:hypothetical protein
MHSPTIMNFGGERCDIFRTPARKLVNVVSWIVEKGVLQIRLAVLDR